MSATGHHRVVVVGAVLGLLACGGGTTEPPPLDATPPAPPVLAAVPASPSRVTTPHLSGTAEAGATVRIYASATCTGVVVASATVTAAGTFDVAVTATPNALTRFGATATDPAGNSSACSVPLDYLCDVQEASPQLVATVPASPSATSAGTLQITGIADTGPSPTTVHVFADDPTCNGGAPGGVTRVGTATASVFNSTGVTVPLRPDASTTYHALATDAAGNRSGCSATGLPFVSDRSEAAPVLIGSSPASPSASTASTLWLTGTAATGPSESTVYLFRDDATCNAGVPGGATQVGSGSAAAFAGAGIAVPLVQNAITTYHALSTDAAGNSSPCSSGLTFTDWTSVAAPNIVASTPASPSGTWASTITLTGTADATHANTVRIYSGTGCAGPALAVDSAAAFQASGMAVPFAGGATTRFYAQATDALGNVSACSGPFAFTSNRVSYCAGAVQPGDVFSSQMHGCAGTVTHASRQSICGDGMRVCTADEWVMHRGTTSPSHIYWTDDDLRFSADGSCGTASCTAGHCFATKNADPSYTGACSPPSTMMVCSGASDAEGNTCPWTGCGYGGVAPDQFLGGCGSTAGALCCFGLTRWGVDAVNGSDANEGTPEAPFRTIGQALAHAVSGQQVVVKPGDYGAAHGETFPLVVPAGVALTGDEATRGTGPAPTRIAGTVAPAAGATVAGFTVSANPGVGIQVYQPTVTVRSNTVTASSGYPVHLTATGATLQLNTVADNPLYLRVEGTGGGKFENNAFIRNAYGVVLLGAGADLGGGGSSSIGNNTFSCNTSADVHAVTVAVGLANNRWDRVPLAAASAYYGVGQDLYYGAIAANLASAQTAASVAASPCNNCASASSVGQVFDGFMMGCGAPGAPPAVAFVNRASLCAPGCRPCTAAEYVAHRSGQVPATTFWTNDLLDWFSFISNGNCSVSATSAGGVPAGCGPGTMLVCPSASGCFIRQCGLDTATPVEYFGGCSSHPSGFAWAGGTLCCCF